MLQSLKPVNFLDDPADKQCQTLENLLQKGELRLWKSAVVTNDNTVAPLLRTFPVSLEFLSSRTGGKLTGETLGVVGGTGQVSLDDIKDATIAVTLGASALAVASLKFLPENIGATVCYLIGTCNPWAISLTFFIAQVHHRSNYIFFDTRRSTGTDRFRCNWIHGTWSYNRTTKPSERHSRFCGDQGSKNLCT